MTESKNIIEFNQKREIITYFEEWVTCSAKMAIRMSRIFSRYLKNKEIKHNEEKIILIKQCLEIGKKKMNDLFSESKTSLSNIFREEIKEPILSEEIGEKVRILAEELSSLLEENYIPLVESKSVLENQITDLNQLEDFDSEYEEEDEFLDFFDPNNLKCTPKISLKATEESKESSVTRENHSPSIEEKELKVQRTNELFEEICETKRGDLLSPSKRGLSIVHNSHINLNSFNSESQISETEEYNIYSSPVKSKTTIKSGKPPLYSKKNSLKNIGIKKKNLKEKMVSSNFLQIKNKLNDKENIGLMKKTLSPKRNMRTSRIINDDIFNTPSLKEKIKKTNVFHTREYLFQNLQSSDMNFKIKDLDGIKKGISLNFNFFLI